VGDDKAADSIRDTAVELRFYQYIAGFSTMMERHGQSAIYALMLVLVNCILGQY
jgi:hypothetical protein